MPENATQDPQNLPATTSLAGTTEPKDGQNEPPQTFTQEQMEGILGKRLAEKDKAWEKKLNETIAKERAEAERVAKLTAEEKEKELRSKQEMEMIEREKELSLRENKLLANELLEKAGIPIALAEFVVNTDGDVMKSNIEKLIAVFSASVQEVIQKKFPTSTPLDPSSNKVTVGTPRRTL